MHTSLFTSSLWTNRYTALCAKWEMMKDRVSRGLVDATSGDSCIYPRHSSIRDDCCRQSLV